MSVIPTANSFDWPNVVGAKLSLPVYTNIINVKNSPYNAVGDGVTDDTTAIQSAINAATTGDVVYFPNGTYRTTSQLNVQSKSIVLRGAGRVGMTWLSHIQLDTSAIGDVIKIYSSSLSSTAIDISSGYTKDSTSLTFADASAISTIAIDDIIVASDLNASGLVYNDGSNSTGTPPSATWLGLSSGARCQTQIVKVTNKSGATLSIGRPLYWTLVDTPQILEIAKTPLAGVEDLKLSRTQTSANYQASNCIEIVYGVNCWVKNCELTQSDGAGVRLVSSYGCVVRDSYIHDPLSSASGHGYAVTLFGPNSDHLIENNVSYKMRHSLIPEGGGSGCIFGYNLCIDDQGSEDTTFLHGSCDTHGCHPFANLWEGNITGKATHDNTWGSASHNTWFRNWVTIDGVDRSFTNGLAGIDIQQHSYYNAVVGCIVGKNGQTGAQVATNGWNGTTRRSYRMGFTSPGSTSLSDSNVSATTTVHRSYDFIGDTGNHFYQLNNAGLDSTLPSSLYLSGRPSWFNASFPPFDPDNATAASISSIPAGYWFMNGGNYPFSKSLKRLGRRLKFRGLSS